MEPLWLLLLMLTATGTRCDTASEDYDYDDTFLSSKKDLVVPNADVCGRKLALSGGSNSEFSPGAWPWLAVLYIDGGTYFRCSATLVTQTHVIAAARCTYRFEPRFAAIEPAEYTVVLGMHNRSIYRQDPAVQQRRVVRITRHPAYVAEEGFRNDLAVLELGRAVRLTGRVRPACAWPSTLTSLHQQTGVEAGWSLRRRDYDRAALPRQWSVPVVERGLCVKHNLDEEHFCAGNTAGSGACQGDAGAGLFIPETSPDGGVIWSLGGVFCYYKRNRETDRCELYGAWTELPRYASWLRAVIFGTNAAPSPGPAPEAAECGEVDATHDLVHHGTATRPGDWPWLAALFIKRLLETGHLLEYQCGGALVSTRHVITAAHCVQPRKDPWPRRADLEVQVGKHYLPRTEDTAQAREVDEILVHENWGVPGRYDGDLALLVLIKPVRITSSVRPVCLWNRNMVFGKNGTVVGWGADELGNAVSQTPKLARMPLVSYEQCRASDPRFQKLVTVNTVCAGAQDGVGPCSGDSGSGLYMPIRGPSGPTGRWMVRGVVSRSLKNTTTSECDLSKYVIFSDLDTLGSWLENKIQRTSPRTGR